MVRSTTIMIGLLAGLALGGCRSSHDDDYYPYDDEPRYYYPYAVYQPAPYYVRHGYPYRHGHYGPRHHDRDDRYHDRNDGHNRRDDAPRPALPTPRPTPSPRPDRPARPDRTDRPGLPDRDERQHNVGPRQPADPPRRNPTPSPRGNGARDRD